MPESPGPSGTSGQSKYRLVDSEANTEEALVDDVRLVRGGDAVALTQGQHDRLVQAGARLVKD